MAGLDAQSLGFQRFWNRPVIFTDREIRLSIQEGLVGVDPLPTVSAYSSTSLDLSLDGTVREFEAAEAGLDLVIDPAASGYAFNRAIARVSSLKQIHPNDGYILPRQRLVLGWTRERIHLKRHGRVAARVEGKSSLARLGLAVHVTAPTIHAGFNGRIRLEIVNHGPVPIRLRQSMRICQLIFEQTLGTPDRGYQGRFSGQDITRRG